MRLVVWTHTAVHCSKPVARRDVGEVACGQVAVGLEAVLHSEALYQITVSERSMVSLLTVPPTSSLSRHHSPRSARRGKSRSWEEESLVMRTQRLR
jgi:hypothetical protein